MGNRLSLTDHMTRRYALKKRCFWREGHWHRRFCTVSTSAALLNRTRKPPPGQSLAEGLFRQHASVCIEFVETTNLCPQDFANCLSLAEHGERNLDLRTVRPTPVWGK